MLAAVDAPPNSNSHDLNVAGKAVDSMVEVGNGSAAWFNSVARRVNGGTMSVNGHLSELNSGVRLLNSITRLVNAGDEPPNSEFSASNPSVAALNSTCSKTNSGAEPLIAAARVPSSAWEGITGAFKPLQSAF